MSEIFDEATSFEALGLGADILRSLKEMGFENPTHIQSKLIPAILEGKDVLGQAKTGTGKTAAFALPIIQKADPLHSAQALVLVPTRELAAQLAAEIEDLGKHTKIRAGCVIGGESMQRQSRFLQKGMHIVVGTPGRVMDMHQRGQLSFDRIRFVVLDEVDRMLDIGFRDDIRKTLGQIRQDHQTIFVSATIGPEIESLARSFMKRDAKKIIAMSGALTVSLVDQKHLPVEPWDKKQLLLHLFQHEKPDTTVVFCRTKHTVHKLTQYLRDHNLNVREIHGDLPQTRRNKVMEAFRQGSLDVLVASDLAARGLDVEHISHVINYDLPDDPEVYVHRIGRTARAGKRGIAWSFVTSEQGQLLTEIEKLTGVIIEKMEYPEFQPGPVPDDIAQRRTKDSQRRRTKTPAQAMAERAITAPVETNGMTQEEIKKKFPSGIIPKTAPQGGLGRHFRSRR